MTTKQTSTRYSINYDTKWSHDYLDPSKDLYFKAKTPIQEIVPKLENHLNSNEPQSLKENYQAPAVIRNFNRLYHNLDKSYKGWEVFYRTPESNQNYGLMTERIGYEKRVKNRYALKKTLSRPMLWKHDLYPSVQPVEIKSALNCVGIATQLNGKSSQAFRGLSLKEWLPYNYLDGLNRNYHELVEKDSDLSVLKDTNHAWQTFLNNLQSLYTYSQKLNASSNFKKYTMNSSNVYDVLTGRNHNSKGWSVEFLD